MMPGTDRTGTNVRSIRRSAWLLAAIALAFYAGFILMGVVRAGA